MTHTPDPGPPLAHTPLVLRARVARDLMTPSPNCVFETDPLETAAEVLSKLSAVPVVDLDRRCVGVVSRTDLARVYGTKHSAGASLTLESRPSASGLDSSTGLDWRPPTRRVADAMTPHVITVTQDTLAAEVVATLRDKRIGRVFVVDAERHLIGVISTTDIINRLATS